MGIHTFFSRGRVKNTIQPSYYRRRASGAGIVWAAMTLMVGGMVSAVAVDTTYMLTEQAHLQSAADAGALAAAQSMARTTVTTPSTVRADAQRYASAMVDTYSSANNPVAISNSDVTFGYINPANPVYSSNSFSATTNASTYTFTGGYNAVRVIVRRTEGSTAGALPSLMANLFGVRNIGTQATAVAMLDNSVNSVGTGLRPFYACKDQYTQFMALSNSSTHRARIYGDHHSIDGTKVSTCGDNPSGNWGFADFRDSTSGAPGNSTVSRWVEQGYGSASGENAVVLGQNYSTQPGDAISSNGVKSALEALRDNQTVITIPLISYTDSGSNSNENGKGKGKGNGNSNGSGSNVSVPIQGFAGFVITAINTNGSANSRYIEGYFTQAMCNGTNCSRDTSGQSTGNLFKTRLVG